MSNVTFPVVSTGSIPDCCPNHGERRIRPLPSPIRAVATQLSIRTPSSHHGRSRPHLILFKSIECSSCKWFPTIKFFVTSTSGKTSGSDIVCHQISTIDSLIAIFSIRLVVFCCHRFANHILIVASSLSWPRSLNISMPLSHLASCCASLFRCCSQVSL